VARALPITEDKTQGLPNDQAARASREQTEGNRGRHHLGATTPADKAASLLLVPGAGSIGLCPRGSEFDELAMPSQSIKLASDL